MRLYYIGDKVKTKAGEFEIIDMITEKNPYMMDDDVFFVIDMGGENGKKTITYADIID